MITLFRPRMLTGILVLLCAAQAGYAAGGASYKARILRNKGYKTDTIEQIMSATKDRSYVVRSVALGLLVERQGKDAVPALKIGLEDKEPRVRCRAAEMLAKLGDRSGAERMRADLKTFAPDNGIPPPPPSKPLGRYKEFRRKARLSYALEAAKVLVELDDMSGFELAARTALESSYAHHRTKAVRALAAMARRDAAKLKVEGRDVPFVLTAVAESERSRGVFGTLVSELGRMDGSVAAPVLQAAAKSPFQSAAMHSSVERALRRMRLTRKASPK